MARDLQPRQPIRPRQVFVVLTVEEARHTAAYLKASTCEMLPELGNAWKQTPVGRAQAKIEAASHHTPIPEFPPEADPEGSGPFGF